MNRAEMLAAASGPPRPVGLRYHRRRRDRHGRGGRCRVARLRRRSSRTARFRKGHFEPQHQARSRRRALSRTGQRLARHGGAQGARHPSAKTRRIWSPTLPSWCRATSGGRRPSTASGSSLRPFAGKYGFGPSKNLSKEETLERLRPSRPKDCAAASSTTTANSTIPASRSTWPQPPPSRAQPLNYCAGHRSRGRERPGF